jgi:hypothetical protein
MPRKLRIQYAGAMYHVMSRGDRREKIFLDDIDRQDFIKTLAGACQKTGWQVHAYCLMPNHYHLVLEFLRNHWWNGGTLGQSKSDLAADNSGIGIAQRKGDCAKECKDKYGP